MTLLTDTGSIVPFYYSGWHAKSHGASTLQ